jgi:hypothetical protein
MSLSSGEGVGDTYPVGSVRNNRCLPPPHLMTETDLVSETLCCLEYRKVDRAQKPSGLQLI